jgi:hypothetical protein
MVAKRVKPADMVGSSDRHPLQEPTVIVLLFLAAIFLLALGVAALSPPHPSAPPSGNPGPSGTTPWLPASPPSGGAQPVVHSPAGAPGAPHGPG